ncbi:Protein-tyrosine phosphatase, low molecular weight [Catenulispora acidiphila DSM 44928]|uniref:Protein-tyrosine phosphatase, low molecular weight n=1 Tax=Catenulispora acidiphila (strain DSM 44928 / JCM 14897 / NBRC 102108 / NRRL B-24433 / ID139908) TaxID=479433 RepID=C7Q093_CATAD|nr:low molecular weight phosphatase family protein [Catenulispora acidiphila]ACU77426.1 Protein-tyrosine phosphatase, low molecular weight [Catenulispora acidiphila DSM 44928]
MNSDDLPFGPDDLERAEQELTEIANRLAERFTGTFTHATVERYVFESYRALAASARLAAFLPALTERFADDRLVALAYVQKPPIRPVPQVLFICDRNAACSQMAAALLGMQARGRVNIRSAGSRPAAELELGVIAAMAEIGADLSAEYPKPLTDEFVAAADIVVTVGCGDACPVLPGKRYLDWTVPDPEGKDMVEVRRIRDELDLLVTDLLTYLPEAADGVPDDPKGTP